jgi:hypothetical protein
MAVGRAGWVASAHLALVCGLSSAHVLISAADVCPVPKPPAGTEYTDTACQQSGKVDEGIVCELTCSKGHSQDPQGSYQAVCTADGTWKALPEGATVPFAPRCTLCGKNFWSEQIDPAPQECTPCPEHSGTTDSGSESVTACVCDAGYSGQIHAPDSSCQACDVGRYKPAGESECTPCPSASTTRNGASSKVSDCLCKPGHHGAIVRPSDDCQPCAAGTYKASIGPESCSGCPPESDTDERAGATTARDCLCRPGYRGDITNQGDRCTPCPQDTYNDVRGPGECVPCPEHAHTRAPASDERSQCECEEEWSGVILRPSDQCCGADAPKNAAGQCEPGDGAAPSFEFTALNVVLLAGGTVALCALVGMCGVYLGGRAALGGTGWGAAGRSRRSAFVPEPTSAQLQWQQQQQQLQQQQYDDDEFAEQQEQWQRFMQQQRRPPPPPPPQYTEDHLSPPPPPPSVAAAIARSPREHGGSAAVVAQRQSGGGISDADDRSAAEPIISGAGNAGRSDDDDARRLEQVLLGGAD